MSTIARDRFIELCCVVIADSSQSQQRGARLNRIEERKDTCFVLFSLAVRVVCEGWIHRSAQCAEGREVLE